MQGTTFGPIVTRLCGWTVCPFRRPAVVTCTAYAVLIAVSTTRIVTFRKEFADDLMIRAGDLGCSPLSLRPTCSARD